jgi:hypothetical protein
MGRAEATLSVRHGIGCRREDDAVVAGGWGVPIPWNGLLGDLPSGYDDALVRAVQAREAGTPATTLSFMAAAAGSAPRACRGNRRRTGTGRPLRSRLTSVIG